jgi:hypothetical protein
MAVEAATDGVWIIGSRDDIDCGDTGSDLA